MCLSLKEREALKPNWSATFTALQSRTGMYRGLQGNPCNEQDPCNERKMLDYISNAQNMQMHVIYFQICNIIATYCIVYLGKI